MVDSSKVQEVIPNPDPSTVTTSMIEKTVKNAFDVTTARLDGMQKAVEVFQADLTRVPTAVDRAVLGLRELLETRFKAVESDVNHNIKGIQHVDGSIVKEIEHLHALMITEIEKLGAVTTERFLGVAAQFAERDTRTDQRAGDTKLAVDAAFAAAKEATAKIEAGFTKQIDGMVTIIDTKTSNLAGGLGDLKERFTALEARTQGLTSGRESVRVETQDNRGALYGSIGMIIGISAIIMTVLLHFIK
jgi:hypothetical protein